MTFCCCVHMLLYVLYSVVLHELHACYKYPIPYLVSHVFFLPVRVQRALVVNAISLHCGHVAFVVLQGNKKRLWTVWHADCMQMACTTHLSTYLQALAAAVMAAAVCLQAGQLPLLLLVALHHSHQTPPVCP